MISSLPENKKYIELSKGQQFYRHIKRIIDVFLAVLAMIVLAIPTLIVSVISKILRPHEKVIFSQQRVGREGKHFWIYKFRTLSNVPEYVPSAELFTVNHVSRWGKFLRKSSIDELPQLINIIKGDMSFIGPRPLIPQEIKIHLERMDRGVYQVRPGLTGLAQVKGRNTLNPRKKIVYDAFYVQHIGPLLDLKIFFISIFKVLKEEDT